MPNFETLHGYRVVAKAAALDAVVTGDLALRLAPDDLFILGPAPDQIDDHFAIVEQEAGFSGIWLTSQQFTDVVLPHIDWTLPADRPALAQGLVANVPAKLWLTDDQVLLFTNSAYAHDLAERIHE